MKPIGILVILLFLYAGINAQTIENIKRSSANNQANSSNHSYSSGSSDDMSGELCGACAEACIEGCFSDLSFAFFSALGDWSNNTKLREPEVPQINSFDIESLYSLPTLNHRIFAPRIRLNGALLSTDFRLSFHREDRLDETDSYNTVDWQALVFNLVVDKNIYWRLGAGFMYEDFSGDVFPEFSTSMDIRISKMVKLWLEGRLGSDWDTGVNVRSEFNSHIGIKLAGNNGQELFLNLGFLSARYYEEVSFHTYQIGLSYHIY